MNPESRTSEHISVEIMDPVEPLAQLLQARSTELLMARLVADEPGGDDEPPQPVSTEPVALQDISPPNFWLPLCFVAAPVLPILLLLGSFHSCWPKFVSMLSIWAASNGLYQVTYSLCLTMFLLLYGLLGLALALVLEGRKNLNGRQKILIFVVIIGALAIVVPLLITLLFFPSIG